MGGDVLSPMARAERVLTQRMLDLEQAAAENPEQWDRYLRTVDILLRVREALQGGGPRITRAELARFLGLTDSRATGMAIRRPREAPTPRP
jgi:hypothetical protein